MYLYVIWNLTVYITFCHIGNHKCQYELQNYPIENTCPIFDYSSQSVSLQLNEVLRI